MFLNDSILVFLSFLNGFIMVNQVCEMVHFCPNNYIWYQSLVNVIEDILSKLFPVRCVGWYNVFIVYNFFSITNWLMCKCAYENHFEVRHISHVYTRTLVIRDAKKNENNKCITTSNLVNQCCVATNSIFNFFFILGKTLSFQVGYVALIALHNIFLGKCFLNSLYKYLRQILRQFW